jgi:hypothetical protein
MPSAGRLVGVPLVALAALTVAALEGREVVVVRTTDGSGGTRETRVWIGDEGGAAWVEAANPGRPFLRDVQGNAAVELRREGAWRWCHAAAVEGPEGHARIRRLLAAKYGWADCWVGLLTDTSASVAVRLDCG